MPVRWVHLARLSMIADEISLIQTCVAPDYVLVPKDGEEAFIAALEEAYANPGHFLTLQR
jgi:hypothetical protein